MIHLVGEFFHSPLLPPSGPLAWASLAAYVVVAGRDSPLRVRIALAAGLLILGAFAAVPLHSTVDSGSSGGYFQYLSSGLQPGLRYGMQESVAVLIAAPAGPYAAGWALGPAIQLAAAAAVTVGCLRRPAPA